MEFDPRLSVAKISPRLMVAAASVLVIATAWKLSEPLRTPSAPVIDPQR